MTSNRFQYSRLVALGLVVVFVLASRSSSSLICSRNEECEDGDPNTFKFCSKPSCCVVIAKSANQSAPFTPITLQETVKEFNAFPLSVTEKQVIVSAATKIMADFNPHRFLQLNLLNVDIVSELQNFSNSLSSPALREQSNLDFHESMKQIFTKMNDFHTAYDAPTRTIATLGFRVEEFYIRGEADGKGKPRARYVVADVAEGLAPSNRGFGVGVEILRWNGNDIGAVVKELGERSYGSNKAAQMRVGIDLLTFRLNARDQIPFENGVKIQYRTTAGKVATAFAKWFFAKENGVAGRAMARVLGRQYTDTWRESHSTLRDDFRISSIGENTNVSTSSSARCGTKKVKKIAVSSDFSELFAAEILETDTAGEVGRIILPSFGSVPTPELLTELTRILSVMPKNGLILDARDNAGGSPAYAKILSTLVSGKAFECAVTSVRATNFTLTLASSKEDFLFEQLGEVLSKIAPALQTAVRVGEPFSGPITGAFGEPSEDVLSRLSRAYFGPVVSLVNGRTYSAGDVFAAVQVDRNTSILVGTSDNVGAGGAFTIPYRVLAIRSSELTELRGRADFSTAFARFYRSGNNSGAIIESFGTKPQIRYFPTLKDAIEGDCDLFEFLGKLLLSKSSA